MKPFISIITPTYNHELFISQCIDSVINQTYDDWEQIVIDDCSKDTTYAIASQYAKNDTRIKIVRHKSKWGIKKLKETYNQALSLCKGNYIAILEGDDFWPKDKLLKQIRCFANKNIVLSYGDWIMTNEKGQPIRLYTQNADKSLLNNSHKGSILTLFLSLKFFLLPSTVMIKKQSVVRIGGFQNDFNYPFIDIPTFLQLALIGKFAYQKEILGYYRKQKESSWLAFAKNSTSMGRIQMQKCFENFWKSNKSKLKKLNINLPTVSDQNKFIQSKKSKQQLSLLLNFLASGEKDKSHTLLKNILTQNSQSLSNKIAALVILFFIFLHIDFFNIFFKAQHLIYKLRRLSCTIL